MVLVPEAPMHEDDLLQTRKHEIRRPRHVRSVQSKAESEAVSGSPYPHLRLGAGLADAAHVFATLLAREMIRHRGAEPRHVDRRDVYNIGAPDREAKDAQGAR